MTEKQETIDHARHPGQGPHLVLPAGFTPLRLRVVGRDAQIEVNGPIATVGRRSDTDLRLAFPDISRRHCQFVFANRLWRVYDLHSLNGVYVNNLPIDEATLYAGDHVRVGAVTFLVISATPLRDKKNEKLRQIVEVLQADTHQ